MSTEGTAPNPFRRRARPGDVSAMTAWWRLKDLADQTLERRDELIARLAGLLVSAHGAPVRVPVTEPELERALSDGARLEAAHRTALARDADRRLDTATRPARSGWRLSSGMLGTYALLGAYGGLVGVLGILWRKAKAAARAAATLAGAETAALTTVVKSISAALATMPPGDKEAAKQVLEAVQGRGSPTERRVAEVKTA